MSGDMLSVMNQYVISKNLHYLYRPLGTNPYKSNGKGNWVGGGEGGGGGETCKEGAGKNISQIEGSRKTIWQKEREMWFIRV